jgi:imidazole glycerol-phosphate synthase subunit HisH
MIGIIDYGVGNVLAFINVYKKLNRPARLIRSASDLDSVDRMILPGVGAFDYAMKRLDESGMRSVLDEVVGRRNIPVLGVCVGMQMLAQSSQEGRRPGLGWIDGRVIRFEPSYTGRAIQIPHMGWNDVKPTMDCRLFHQIEKDARFYFLHSYYFECQRSEDVIAVTDYGVPFVSAVHSGNFYGVQFHPEKSHQWGIQLLSNFADL